MLKKTNGLIPRLFIACFLLTLSSHSIAQIEDQILAYQDSSRRIINNGRELIVDKIANYDFKGADEVYFYLQKKALEKRQLAFTYSEIIYINLITGNYAELLSYCKDYQTKSYLKTFSAERSISQDLYQHFMEQLIDIKNDLEHTELNAEQLALIKLIIYIIEEDSLRGEYAKLLEAYTKDYPDSEYAYFINKFMPSAPLKASFTWDLGPTLINPTGELSQTFDPRVVMGMAFDFNIKKIYTSFYINAGDIPANKAFTIENTPLYVDDRYSYFNGGGKIGYFLCRNERLHIAPYASISGTTLRTNIYKSEADNDLEIDINKCFTYGAGLMAEIKLFEFSTPYYYGYYTSGNSMMNQYFSLKFDFGYNVNTKSDYPAFEGNSYASHIGFVWGFGIF